jgi:DNA-binding CsgD family transcriptional regulator
MTLGCTTRLEGDSLLTHYEIAAELFLFWTGTNMDLEKGAARRLASHGEFESSNDTSERPSRLLPATHILPASIAATRVLRDVPSTPASRRSRIASALTILPVPSAQPLQEYFDLTSAEVKLAQSLARGMSLEAAARRLDIKMSTARTQLAAIFAKTGTQRQGKLIAILSRIAHMS